MKASNTDQGDDFGISVAVSSDGNTLASGAWEEASAASGINGIENDNIASGSGAAYVFHTAISPQARRHTTAPN